MKWCLLLLLRGAGGRTRHGFRNATRAVRLPVDGALQPIVALDVAPGAVGAALAAYGSRGRACAGSVVVKGRARGSHERNQDGLGAQVLRADQLAPLLLAHALTGLRIACRPHEWDFGDAYGEEGAMAIFGCGRGADGRTRGVGAFATSAELDRLAGTYARRRLIHDELRSAYLRAVPLLRPFVAQETPPALACAARVYAVGIDDFAMWDPDAGATTFVGAAANRSFDLVRTVLRPQFDLVKAARPRPLDVWGDATVRVALHVRRGDVMPVESAARGAGVFPASDFFRPRDPMAELISAHRRGRRLGPAPEGEVQGRRARRVLALPPGLPGEPRERDGARRRRLDRGPRGPARRRRRARRGRHLPRRPAAAAVCFLRPVCFCDFRGDGVLFVVRGPDDSATKRDILSPRSNPPTLCTQAGDAAVERARRRARARPGRDGVGDGPLLLAGLERGRARRGARARRHRLRRGVQPRGGLRLGAEAAPDQDPGGPRGC